MLKSNDTKIASGPALDISCPGWPRMPQRVTWLNLGASVDVSFQNIVIVVVAGRADDLQPFEERLADVIPRFIALENHEVGVGLVELQHEVLFWEVGQKLAREINYVENLRRYLRSDRGDQEIHVAVRYPSHTTSGQVGNAER